VGAGWAGATANLLQMKKMGLGLGTIAMLLSLTASIAVAGPTSPMLLTSDPAEGATMASAPDQVSMTFSQPLDDAYSRLEVYACGKRIDSDVITVTVNEISVPLRKAYRGTYKVFYFANATPKGATGETTGTLTFKVKKGRSCP
jgi:methionine-rich copper-binding protein CopC